MGSILRFGVIGWNDEAEAACRAISGVEGATLTVVGAEASSLQGVEEMLSARLVSQAEAVWQSDDVDAVYVAVPAGAREQVVLDVLHAGKSVLMLPPLALNGASARELLKAATDSGSILGLTSVWAADPAIAAVRTNLRAGLYGAPLLWQSAQLSARPDSDWVDAAANDLGLFHFLTGQTAEMVNARRMGGDDGAEVVLLVVMYAGDVIGTYAIGSGVAGPGQRSPLRNLIGSKGQVDLGSEPQAVRSTSVEDVGAGVWHPVRYIGARAGLEHVVARFVQAALRAEGMSEASEDLLEVPRSLEAARASLCEGRAVRIAR